MPALPITRVVLYKHGVGYFEREGTVDNDATLSLTFKQAEVSDVLKSLTVLDLAGGHISSVSYDSTKPLEQLLAEVALSIPDQGSLVGLLPQIKGARIAVQPASVSTMGVRSSLPSGEPIEGVLLGVDTIDRHTADGIVKVVLLTLVTDGGEMRSFDMYQLANLQILDAALRRDLDYYLRTQLSAKKKDSRTFTFFAQGQGQRAIRLSYTLEAPVWKATYRIILGEEGQPPMIQGWAVVDNTQDEDWENVQLSLIAGLPVSFVHDLYTPRYIRRPVVAVQETTGVLPPEVEDGTRYSLMGSMESAVDYDASSDDTAPARALELRAAPRVAMRQSGLSSMPSQVRERVLGDLFEYEIEHSVTIRRNQSALVPIVLRSFEGRSVLLYNKQTRADNPMRSVEFRNTTGLTLEGGPVTVLEEGNYVGEAMLETMKPNEQRLVPFAVELGVSVLDNVDTHEDAVNRIIVRDKLMTTCRLQIRQTTYSFHNKSTNSMLVYLDHTREEPVRGTEWQLYETPAPFEITKKYWRFRFELPGGQVTRFVVRQRFTSQYSHSLTEISQNHLAVWLQQRYFDQKTKEVLQQVVELRQQSAKCEEEIKKLCIERDSIHAEQKRIRENLQALGDRSSEKELRERFVRTLNVQEDRLEQIEKEIREHTTARDRCREQIHKLLAELEYEATLEG